MLPVGLYRAEKTHLLSRISVQLFWSAPERNCWFHTFPNKPRQGAEHTRVLFNQTKQGRRENALSQACEPYDSHLVGLYAADQCEHVVKLMRTGTMLLQSAITAATSTELVFALDGRMSNIKLK